MNWFENQRLAEAEAQKAAQRIASLLVRQGHIKRASTDKVCGIIERAITEPLRRGYSAASELQHYTVRYAAISNLLASTIRKDALEAALNRIVNAGPPAWHHSRRAKPTTKPGRERS